MQLAKAREETLGRKMEQAQKLLAKGMPVGEVARKVGLPRWKLCRHFKRVFGKTPTRARPRACAPTVSFKLKDAAEVHLLEEAASRAQTSVSAYVGRIVRRHLRARASSEK